MKPFKALPILIAAALATFAGTSRAQQPPDAENSDACSNTALGTNALTNNDNGSSCSGSSSNTALGDGTLYTNTTGHWNTALGADALLDNQTGYWNTATGADAMYNNSIGYWNTATGTEAMFDNTTGNWNTATGVYSLFNNTTGNNNTASGVFALSDNIGGSNNTAFGVQALYKNTAGVGNAAQGYLALTSNTTGNRNLAVGNNALGQNSTGSYNIGLGFDAGLSLTTGSNNIYVGSPGVASESDAIRIGLTATVGSQAAHTAAYVGGIYGTNISGGQAVYVTASGQLVTEGSSERFKRDIETMSDETSQISQLRPVTFKYRNDASGTVQYGLIAEEVAKVYPELVIRGADGQINGVRYEELAPMLLNEVQRQEKEITELKAQLTKVMAVIERQRAPVAADR